MPNLKHKNRNIFINNNGQVLIVMFVLMIVALSIGIAMSSNFIKTLRNLTQTDQSSKALAIAEASIEHLLILPISTLTGYVTSGNCGADCHKQITESNGQVISADAVLSVLGNNPNPYTIDLSQTETFQVNLVGYPQSRPLYICWNSQNMSITGLYINGTVGSFNADAFSYNPVMSAHTDNGFSAATARFGYPSCLTINSVANSNMLRLKAVYEDSSAVIIPDNGINLPGQGILIKATGYAGDAQKSVSVMVLDPVSPAIFDYALYQKSLTEPLSN